MKPTNRTYEIRTLADFLKVPLARRGVCLREFGAWLSVGEYCEAIAPVRADRDVFRWTDGGQNDLYVVLAEPLQQSKEVEL